MKEVSALALYVPLPKTACGRDLASVTTSLYRPFHHKVCTAVLEGCGQGKCPALQLSWHCSRTHGHRAPQRTGLAGHKLRALPSLDHSLPQLQGGTERYQVVDKLPLTTTTGHRHLSWSDHRPVTKCNPEVHATMLLKWLLIVCYW